MQRNTQRGLWDELDSSVCNLHILQVNILLFCVFTSHWKISHIYFMQIHFVCTFFFLDLCACPLAILMSRNWKGIFLLSCLPSCCKDISGVYRYRWLVFSLFTVSFVYHLTPSTQQWSSKGHKLEVKHLQAVFSLSVFSIIHINSFCHFATDIYNGQNCPILVWCCF